MSGRNLKIVTILPSFCNFFHCCSFLTTWASVESFQYSPPPGKGYSCRNAERMTHANAELMQFKRGFCGGGKWQRRPWPSRMAWWKAKDFVTSRESSDMPAGAAKGAWCSGIGRTVPISVDAHLEPVATLFDAMILSKPPNSDTISRWRMGGRLSDLIYKWLLCPHKLECRFEIDLSRFREK